MKPKLSAVDRVIAARSAMLWDQPFWATLAMRLKVVSDPTCDTAWTDGTTLGVNPAFIDILTPKELITVIAHETEHCTRGHPWRRMGRPMDRWNEATDRAINPDLRECGMPFPKGVGLFELAPDHRGRSAEWIFDRLPPQQDQDPQGGGQGDDDQDGTPGGQGDDDAPGQGQTPGDDETPGSGQPGANPKGLGEVRDAPADVPGQDPGPSEEDWRQAVVQAAAVARARGQMPGSLEELVERTTRTRHDWRSVMRRFAQEIARTDYSWMRPSSRYVARGLYLPSLRSEEFGILAVGVDASGSVDHVLLDQFQSELIALAEELQPREIHVFTCDTRIQRYDVFARGETVELHAVGRGGTDFRPVFEKVAEMDEPPVALIYLTDLDGTFPDVAPDVPVLWVTGRDDNELPVPFGEVVTAG